MPSFTEDNFKRLRNAHEWSRRALLPFRTQRKSAIEQFVGNMYGEGSNRKAVPLGLLQMAVSIYTRQLAANNPKALVTTKNEQLVPFAATFSLAIDHTLNEIKFLESAQDWVFDAMFSMGILKVGITPKEMGEVEGYLHDSGQPFADTVDMDDWVHDMTAKKWEQAQFYGNRYVLPYEFVMDSNMFKTGADADRIVSTEHRTMNESGDERVAALSTPDQHFQDGSYDKLMELWDIWLPGENLIVTLAADEGGGVLEHKPLRVVEWDGPEAGPYHRLQYQGVPSNIMPLPPVSMLYDMHMLANVMWRKFGRQAERQKSITVIQGGAEEDGNRVVQTDDGDTVRSDNAGAAKEMAFGGIDPTNMAFFLQLKDMFMMMGGNLETLGGLGSAADTLGQEELLASGASQRIIDWQEKTITATKYVITDIAKYLWSDPLAQVTVMKRPLESAGLEIPVEFNDDVKEGDFIDYNVDIVPYSMQHRGPAEKLKTITQVMERFVAPMMPFMQEQGLGPDMQELMRIIADYTQTPELQRIIKAQGVPVLDKPAVGAEGPGQSPNTTRTNVRVNKPGATRGGKDDALSRILLGSGVQESESAAIGRPTS